MRRLIFALVLCAGCNNVAERRLLVLEQAQIVLKHCEPAADWEEQFALVKGNIDEEIANGR